MTATKLGRTLRRWRDRVTPEAAGMSAGGHRRTAGLRREELALLAGISVDYVTRLEQGRAANPSAQVVEALARALALSEDERAHLYQLAGLVPPGPGTVPASITPSVHRLLNRLTGAAVAVHDAAWTLLLANPLYAALMGDPSGRRDLERNSVWRTFLGPGNSRVRRTPEDRRAMEAALVADLRETSGRYPDDPLVRELIKELHARSARFAELWDAAVVARHRAGRKTVDHPRVGTLTLDCDVLSVAGSDLRLMVYTTEPGTRDAERLALLEAAPRLEDTPAPVG